MSRYSGQHMGGRRGAFDLALESEDPPKPRTTHKNTRAVPRSAFDAPSGSARGQQALGVHQAGSRTQTSLAPTCSGVGTAPIKDDESDSDYNDRFAALNIDNHSNWNLGDPGYRRPKDRTPYLQAQLTDASLSTNDTALQNVRSYVLRPSIRPGHVITEGTTAGTGKINAGSMTCFEQLAQLNYMYRPKKRETFRSTTYRNSQLTHNGPSFLTMEQTLLPRFSPGSITSIAQKDGLVAVASSVAGGGSEQLAGDSLMDLRCNQEGSLKILYDDNQAEILYQHRTKQQGNATRYRYHTVNDVAFDPVNSGRLVSCGKDQRVRMWDCKDLSNNGPRQLRAYHYKGGEPQRIHFRPGSSTFVVSGLNSRVDLYGQGEPIPLQVTSNDNHPVYGVSWGTDFSAHVVFAMSSDRSKRTNKELGCFFGIDSNTQKLVYRFKSNERGECLAVNPAGKALMIAARNEDSDFLLRQHDIREPPRATIAQSVKLRTIRLPTSPERAIPVKTKVNEVSISPDGIHVAIAFNDNTADVYDARYLGKESLFQCAHGKPTEGTLADGLYGITKAMWTQDVGSGLSLLTSGADGCVRLWDLRRLSGRMIASTTSYASWLSLGDQSRGETPLVVGDGGGNVILLK